MIQINRGMHAIVQAADYSRMHNGFAAGGPQDRFSCQLVNQLLGNDRHAGAIELTLAPATLLFEKDCHIVVGGAPCKLQLDGLPQSDWEVLFAKAGSQLQIHIGQTGCRVYLGVAGGLRSDSTFDGAPLSANVGRRKPTLPIDWQPPLGTVRVLPGPEWDETTTPTVLHRPWTIGSQSNAVGLRLTGQALKLRSFDIESAPVQDGTIQATKTGLLALLRDRGTLGGYPRIATVIDCDVDRLAQFRPGQQIRFEQVSENQAQALFDLQQRCLS